MCAHLRHAPCSRASCALTCCQKVSGFEPKRSSRRRRAERRPPMPPPPPPLPAGLPAPPSLSASLARRGSRVAEGESSTGTAEGGVRANALRTARRGVRLGPGAPSRARARVAWRCVHSIQPVKRRRRAVQCATVPVLLSSDARIAAAHRHRTQADRPWRYSWRRLTRKDVPARRSPLADQTSHLLRVVRRSPRTTLARRACMRRASRASRRP